MGPLLEFMCRCKKACGVVLLFMMLASCNSHTDSTDALHEHAPTEETLSPPASESLDTDEIFFVIQMSEPKTLFDDSVFEELKKSGMRTSNPMSIIIAWGAVGKSETIHVIRPLALDLALGPYACCALLAHGDTTIVQMHGQLLLEGAMKEFGLDAFVSLNVITDLLGKIGIDCKKDHIAITRADANPDERKSRIEALVKLFKEHIPELKQRYSAERTAAQSDIKTWRRIGLPLP